jgi:hypothetical protein
MEYQLVLQFSVSDTTDFDELIDLEGRLIVVLAGTHIVDGHDFGSGEMNIFVHTNDPLAAFDVCNPAIPWTLKPTLKAAYRGFSEDEYHWVYPQHSDSDFKIV